MRTLLSIAVPLTLFALLASMLREIVPVVMTGLHLMETIGT